MLEVNEQWKLYLHYNPSGILGYCQCAIDGVFCTRFIAECMVSAPFIFYGGDINEGSTADGAEAI